MRKITIYWRYYDNIESFIRLWREKSREWDGPVLSCSDFVALKALVPEFEFVHQDDAAE